MWNAVGLSDPTEALEYSELILAVYVFGGVRDCGADATACCQGAFVKGINHCTQGLRRSEGEAL